MQQWAEPLAWPLTIVGLGGGDDQVVVLCGHFKLNLPV